MNIVIDFILHLDKYVGVIINQFGIFTYAILFLIIFLETGLVITPFLPGDSLLFVAGTFAALGSLNIFVLFLVFIVAAIAGDSLNYFLGSYFGKKVFGKIYFFKKEHYERTEEFYKKHGGKTIILARFIPVIRTFAPFVAGVGKMKYREFLFYNVVGGIAWVSLFLFGGYFFGGIPVIKDNLTIVIFVIIFLSILPPIIEYFRKR